MGGNISRVLVKKAVRPIKNINVEERAQKAVDRHKTNPIPAPRHSTSKEKIQKQVKEHPEIKEEIEKQDMSLIDRVNRLHLEAEDNMPKIKSSQRPLPQIRENIYADPLLAFEEPRKIPQGKISFKQLRTILDQRKNDLQLHQAEIIVKEYQINLQDTLNVLQYFENINLDEMLAEKSENTDAKWIYDPKDDETINPKS